MSASQIDLTAMFLLGLLGAGHCVGMCGPLVLAFPGRTGKLSSHIFYHLGRLMTYAALGAMMGGLGAGLASVASAFGGQDATWMVRIQVGFSLIAAAFLCLLGLSRLDLIAEPAWMSGASPMRIPGFSGVVKWASIDRRQIGMWLMGSMLGFLPCGLSFAAFTRALACRSAAAGALSALVFGLGTLPALLLVGTAASGLARRYRRHSELLSGILMIGMSVSLLVKALQAVAG